MKAFIFNSGTGSRMGNLTENNPKALVRLSNGESILGRQIRLLKNAGVSEIIISTGPFEDQIISLAKAYTSIKFNFINNDNYKNTNSIYSMFLSKDFLHDDFIILHGDLVFDSKLPYELIYSDKTDLCLINTQKKLPEKDFKGKIVDGFLKKIAVDIFDDNCYSLQPMYKFSKNTMDMWINEVEKFISHGNIKVYAENALNYILDKIHVEYFDYKNYYIEEVDNQEDLLRVSNEFRYYDYKNQTIIQSNDFIDELSKYINNHQIKKPLFVHSKHLLNNTRFNNLLSYIDYDSFTAYSSNPKSYEVLEGLKKFRQSKCDAIIAIGGGSCIDVAKAIKLFSDSKNDINTSREKLNYIDLPFIAFPTTAGTGTESTRYSVIYINDEKHSLTHDCLIPDTCVLDETLLYDLPDYHKKSSLLDAFCQAIESYWSINSNDISKEYSKKSIKLILDNYVRYLDNDKKVYSIVLYASNLSGRAINITQTTAPHALSYKVSTNTGIAHGHAVSLLLPKVFEYMINNINLLQDKRGKVYFLNTLKELSNIFGVDSIDMLPRKIESIFNKFNLYLPTIDNKKIMDFVRSINYERLNNNPILINKDSALDIFHRVFLK